MNTMESTQKTKSRSQWGLIVFRFKKNKLAVVGLVVIVILILVCTAAPLFINYEDVYKQSLSNRFISPNAQHWLGTDQYGRDLFARILYGGRYPCWPVFLRLDLR